MLKPHFPLWENGVFSGCVAQSNIAQSIFGIKLGGGLALVKSVRMCGHQVGVFGQKADDQIGDLFAILLQRKMSGIKNANINTYLEK